MSVWFVIGLILIISFQSGCHAAPKFKYPPSEALDFMKKYGYLEQDDGASEALYTEEGISNIIKTMQRFGAIEQTGKIDNATLKLMKSKRCGVPDIIKHKRRKRYNFGSEGWNKRHITYYIANWSPRLGERTVSYNIQKALDTWGRYGRLTFEKSRTNDADIIVAFGTGYHGDQFPFDGVGNVLAHAFFPYERRDLGGDIHFDADEYWVDRYHNKQEDEDGTDFFTVALHELGHSLGLAHSDQPNSIMFPYYDGLVGEDQEFKLGYDDILGMYQLYINRRLSDDDQRRATMGYEDPRRTTETPRRTTEGPQRTTEDPRRTTKTSRGTTETSRKTQPTKPNYSKPTKAPWKTTTQTFHNKTFEGDSESVDDHKRHDPFHKIPDKNNPSMPDICSSNFDAVATLRGELFIFKDEYIWRLKNRRKILPGYPIKLKDMFPEFPEKKVDAAYERKDGLIVLFSGNRFWVYDGQRFVENSPKSLTYYGLPEDLDGIDAVQVWGRNKKLYIYKNDRFWRFNETEGKLDPGYPRDMEVWRKIPENLDAATTWIDGYTYFFKGGLYWKFDNDWIIATDESPLPIAQIWLGCPEDYRMKEKRK